MWEDKVSVREKGGEPTKPKEFDSKAGKVATRII